MARLIFTSEEIVNLVIRNVELPEQVSEISAEGSTIAVLIKPAKLIPKINVRIMFQSFEDGKMILKFGTPIPAKIINILMDIFVKNPDIDGIDIDYPIVKIRINELLGEAIKGLEIKDIVYNSKEEFTILTK